MNSEYDQLKKDLAYQLQLEQVNWDYFIETALKIKKVDPSNRTLIPCPDCKTPMTFRLKGRWETPSFECNEDKCSGYVTARSDGTIVAIPANQETRAYRYLLMMILKHQWGVEVNKGVGGYTLEECKEVMNAFDVEVVYVSNHNIKKGYVLQLVYDRRGTGASVPPEKRIMESPQ